MVDNGIWDLYVTTGVEISNFPVYPKLTSEQQIELFKVLCHGRWIEIAQHAFKEGEWYAGGVDYKRRTYANSFEEVLCKLILKYWSEMSENDKGEVRRLLSNLAPS